jgi:hypothetical protein
MSILNKLATSLNRQDDVPNQEGIRKIVGGLSNQEKAIRSDIVKVLYEIGYPAPELAAPYARDFLKLLESRNNRLVWGGMIALSKNYPTEPILCMALKIASAPKATASTGIRSSAAWMVGRKLKSSDNFIGVKP